ncbi:kinase-like domain-containing protein, partial [Dichotomopilus funicola]
GCFPVFPNNTVLVGRDGARNHIAFDDPIVSRCQLEIFSVVADDDYPRGHPPLVFVRDRGSANGTSVNGRIIGKGVTLSPSKLLEEGDIITVGTHPHLRLQYAESTNIRSSYTLSRLQRQEVKLFEDRYIVSSRTIGNGGYSLVFLASEVDTRKHVACKVHDISRFSPTAKEVTRIRQEATLLSTLDHPNILPIKATFETEQTIYVITELATGGDLFSLLMRYNTLDEWVIKSIIRQVLLAVVYIHSKGVAHRDIKPENILCGVTPSAPYRIMLSDFGASGLPGSRRLESNVGTPFFRPPECDAPGRGHDTSVDIWAIGMLTMQLVLGNRQFPDLEPGTFKSQGHIDNYLSMLFSELGPRGLISNAGQSFICGCLVYDNEKRPTARQAFSHNWLQRPSSDRALFKRLEADNATSWAPQKVKFPVIETLDPDTDHSQHGHVPASEIGMSAFSRYFTAAEPGNAQTVRKPPKE